MSNIGYLLCDHQNIDTTGRQGWYGFLRMTRRSNAVADMSDDAVVRLTDVPLAC